MVQKSSICRAAVHAGVIQNESGGYVDVMAMDRKNQYSGSSQNGVTSERYGLKRPGGGLQKYWRRLLFSSQMMRLELTPSRLHLTPLKCVLERSVKVTTKLQRQVPQEPGAAISLLWAPLVLEW